MTWTTWKRNLVFLLLGSLTTVLIAGPIVAYQVRMEKQRVLAARQEAERTAQHLREVEAALAQANAARAEADAYRAHQEAARAEYETRQRIQWSMRMADNPAISPEERNQYADHVRLLRATLPSGK